MFVRVDIDFAIFAQEQSGSILHQLKQAIDKELSRRYNSSPELDSVEMEHIRKGNKIYAIKALRERMPHLSLRACLDVIDLYKDSEPEPR